MSDGEKLLLTEQGWNRLREELLVLQRQQRSRAGECMDIAQSAERGGKESEYRQSKLACLDRRVEWLEEVLSKAMPVDTSDHVPGAVGIGSPVIVRWEDGEEEGYTIVGPPEVDTPAGRISYESPIGQALMGRHAGEWVTAEPPGGRCRLQLLVVE